MNWQSLFFSLPRTYLFGCPEFSFSQHEVKRESNSMGYPPPASYTATWFCFAYSATVEEEVMMSPFHIAAFFILQADDAAVLVPHSPLSGFSAIIDMVRNSGPVAIAVLVLLLIASLYSWAVILGK